MENASKALIIAGAILISILLISVGIIVMNAINEPVESAGTAADTQAIQIFNSQFSTYEGNDINYNTAKQCITAVKATQGSAHEIIFDDGGITKVTQLNRNKTYSIEFGTQSSSTTASGGTLINDGKGYFVICKITENT